MDPLRLLSRSTRLSKNGYDSSRKNVPSSGQTSLAKVDNQCKAHPSSGSRKRKRGESDSEHVAINFFENDNRIAKPNALPRTDGADNLVLSRQSPAQSEGSEHAHRTPTGFQGLSLEEKKGILKKHKLKIAWLNPSIGKQKTKRNSKAGKKLVKAKVEKETLFPNPLESFKDLGTFHRISNRIVSNIKDEGYSIPTEVQLVALPLLLDRNLSYLHSENTENIVLRAFNSIDLLTVAPTGSGKTLAFLIPLAQGIAIARSEQEVRTRSISAIILAPTKELAGQIVNEGRKLVAGTGTHISQARKGMRLTLNDDLSHHESTEAATIVKSDILVSTPGTLEGIIRSELEHDQSPLSSVRYLVLDEADVLLDPLFREQTLTVWHTLTHPDLRVSLWSATMGSNIEELAHAQINEYRVRLSLPEAPLIRLVVGLKDSAVPNVQHKLIYAASEQGKLMSLRQILHPTSSSADAGPTLVPPFLIFTQTIERAIALHSELLYDIPAEAGGISRIAVLHSDLSDTARDRVMTRFRRAEIWVLITTDLLSRGIDFRGVNGVVNYDIPTSSAAYVHRVGRTGRAGREGGVAITLYTREDIPYLKSIANVVAAAQKLPGAVDSGHGVQPWLLDSLPSLSKKVKQELKRRGVESRTARGKEKDPKAARRARISTKAGFVRREDNRRKGAIVGTQRRQQDEKADTDGDEESGSDFGGFD